MLNHSRVERITETGCHIWMGTINSNGYGVQGVGGKAYKAHRLAYGLDKIPEGMFVCHKCDVRACVNPEHLFLGTRADNMQDMSRKGRAVNQKKTCCPRGHSYDKVRPRGDRYCSICHADSMRIRRASI